MSSAWSGCTSGELFFTNGYLITKTEIEVKVNIVPNDIPTEYKSNSP